jgi:hypothetical protein
MRDNDDLLTQRLAAVRETFASGTVALLQAVVLPVIWLRDRQRRGRMPADQDHPITPAEYQG